jgi:hypothetical protein
MNSPEEREREMNLEFELQRARVDFFMARLRLQDSDSVIRFFWLRGIPPNTSWQSEELSGWLFKTHGSCPSLPPKDLWPRQKPQPDPMPDKTGMLTGSAILGVLAEWLEERWSELAEGTPPGWQRRAVQSRASDLNQLPLEKKALWLGEFDVTDGVSPDYVRWFLRQKWGPGFPPDLGPEAGLPRCSSWYNNPWDFRDYYQREWEEPS